jgi:hypothetical protein
MSNIITLSVSYKMYKYQTLMKKEFTPDVINEPKQYFEKIIISFMFRLRYIVSNAIFNNISVISWRSVLLVEETGVPGENH